MWRILSQAEEGKLLLAGALADPVDGALFIFKEGVALEVSHPPSFARQIDIYQVYHYNPLHARGHRPKDELVLNLCCFFPLPGYGRSPRSQSLSNKALRSPRSQSLSNKALRSPRSQSLSNKALRYESLTEWQDQSLILLISAKIFTDSCVDKSQFILF
jgi:hypothetical protein